MTITTSQAYKLNALVQPFPNGKPGEVYITVPNVRVALGCEPNCIQDMPFYMRPDTVEQGGWAQAVYVLNKDSLEKFASKHRAGVRGL